MNLTLTLFVALMSSTAIASITNTPWGKTASGEDVHLFTLTNTAGLTARITNFGGILVSLSTPDKGGQFADIVLGFDSLDPYLKKHPFFGCITGRYANRIGGASFVLDGTTHRITANSGKHHIHGGNFGFDEKVWSPSSRTLPDGVALDLASTSTAGEEGFPGSLACTVTYTLRNDNSLAIHYHATTDATTVLNLTNHSYFNLAGEGHPTALDHELTIPAETFTPTDDDLIPTGKVASLLGTPLDFTQPRLIGDRIDADFLPLKQGKGYDHNFILPGSGLKLAARVRHPASGRTMEVRTTEPAVQLYTANHLKGAHGKNGHTYPARSAFCLETQHYPDSPNHPNFPSTTLRPGETFHSTTTFIFTAQ
jgi:aldose 1-epimerase